MLRGITKVLKCFLTSFQIRNYANTPPIGYFTIPYRVNGFEQMNFNNALIPLYPSINKVPILIKKAADLYKIYNSSINNMNTLIEYKGYKYRIGLNVLMNEQYDILCYYTNISAVDNIKRRVLFINSKSFYNLTPLVKKLIEVVTSGVESISCPLEVSCLNDTTHLDKDFRKGISYIHKPHIINESIRYTINLLKEKL